MPPIVDFHDAKTNLSKLLEKVRRGEEVVIGRAGRPVARLVPVEPQATRRKPGSARGTFRMSDDFEAPLPKRLLDAFEE